MILLLKSLRQILTSVSQTPPQENGLGNKHSPIVTTAKERVSPFGAKKSVFLRKRTFMRDREELNRGFTLIEVALAIAILGIGLATITTLSTRLVDDTFYEVGRSNGTILALYILETETAAAASNSNTDNSNQNQSGALIGKLDALGYFSGLDKQIDFPYLNENWSYELKFEPLNLPVSETNFNIVTAIVRWGNSDFETVHLQTIAKSSRKSGQQTGSGSGSGSGSGGGGNP